MELDLEDEIDDIKPPAVVEAVSDSLLPKISKIRYERTYSEFQKWQNEQNTSSLSERTILEYFLELSEKVKPTSLWAYYSMLKSVLRLKNGVDISTYQELTALLKKQSEGYRPLKANVFTEEQLREFVFGASDEEWLVVKVVCIFGLCGALRIEEFVNICYEDMKIYPDMLYVQIDASKTKMLRSFTITGEFYDVVKKYMNLRPAKMVSTRFFIRYQNGRCTHQVMGKNQFSKIPRTIAKYLNLPEPDRYTGHSFRRTSATILANTGANIETIKKHKASEKQPPTLNFHNCNVTLNISSK